MIDATIEAAYAALAFGPGEEPDWAAFDATFVPEAVLALRVFPEDPAVSVLGLRGYRDAQLARGVREAGYAETPGDREVEVVRDVALVRQPFTMHLPGRDPVPALDVFTLVRRQEGWRIVAVVSDLADGADDATGLERTLERALGAHAYDPSGAHDWATLDAVFVPGALMGLRFFPDDPDTWVVGVREFMDHPRRDNPLRDGYAERDRVRTVQVTGDVALVHERFRMTFAQRAPVPAIDVFTLARVDGDWRIVSFISDAEEQP